MVTNVTRINSSGNFYTSGSLDEYTGVSGVASRTYSNGSFLISNTGIFDEVTNNPAALGSLLFDGTSGYISAPDSVNLQLSTGDFTVEGWFYLNALGAVRGLVAKGTGSTGWEVRVTAANVLAASYTSTALTGTTTITTNVWYHFAFVRSGSASGNIKLYLNGALEATSATAITTDFNQTDVLAVGNSRPLNQYFSGNICNVRILKGTALYTAAFTSPVQPPNAITNTQFLLNPPNTSVNNILDTSTNAVTITKVGTVTSSPQTPITLDGFYNYYFNNATPDYLTIAANTAYNISTGNYTIECFAYGIGSGAAQRGIFTLTPAASSGASGISVYVNTSNTISFFVDGNGSGKIQNSATQSFLPSVWNHVALVGNGGTNTLYVNGVSVATNARTPTVSNVPVNIGRQYGDNVAQTWNGYISNFRVVIGTALYTATFTPPSAPLTAITNTKVLSCKSNKIVDSSSIGAAFTITGTPSVNSNTSPFTTYNYAGSGFAVQRAVSSGKFQITGKLDEWTGIPIADSSLLLWWDAAQTSSYSGSGSTLTDLTNNANTGTLNASPTFKSLIGGGTLLFDGVSQTATIATLNLQQNFTLETWVNQNVLNGFAMFGQGTGTTSAGLHIWYAAAGTIRFGMFGNDTDFTVSTTTGVWYHMVFTYNHSSPYTKGFYLNAVAQSGTAQQTQAAYAGSGVFRLGAIYSSGGNYGNGYFQGAKVYNRSLTADDVTLNYNALKGRY